LAAFVAAAVVLVSLLFGASFVVVGARETTLERVRASAPTIKRWGGYVLIVVGAWFVALGIWADTFAALFPV
jgi:hypothetical protein